MIGLAASMAMAKPMFWLSSMIAVLMPTTAPVGVDQRPARVARVDGGIGLDQVGAALRPVDRSRSTAETIPW